MPKVSIIVPVYKAEQYLHRCVDSILSQSFIDWELILVDDGSPDRSGAICDEYAQKDDRIRVIHKENGGISSARNIGINNAQGEWLTFVDSDDWIEGDALGLVQQAQDNENLLVMDIVQIKENCKKLLHKKAQVLKDETFRNKLYKYIFDTVFLAPWAKFFRLDIIKKYNIVFDEEIKWAEDRLFNLSYLSHINSIRFLGKGCYVYVMPNQSETIMKYHITPVMLTKLRDKIKVIVDSMKEVKRLTRTYTLLWSTMEKICILNKSFDEEERRAFYNGQMTFQSVIDNIFPSKPLNVFMYIFCAKTKNTRNNCLVNHYILKR